MRNISVFCLWRVALYFKAMPNSIDFYKEIFLHVIPVCIIVPCLHREHKAAGIKEIIIIYTEKFLKFNFGSVLISPGCVFRQRYPQGPYYVALYSYSNGYTNLV